MLEGGGIGALLLGRAIDKGFAQRLKDSLGEADVVFYLRSSIVATTVANAALNNLPQRYAKQRKQIDKDGRSTAVQLGGPPFDFAWRSPVPRSKGVVACHLNGSASAGEAWPTLFPGRSLEVCGDVHPR